MSLADTQYLNIIENILDHGIYGQNRTGIATYKLPQQIMQFDLQEEFPILTTKFVAFKTAVKDNLIKTIKEDPDSRRMIVTLWNIEDLPDMALQPCAYETLWDVGNGYLNCILIQRSGDMGLGVPFNTAQYAALLCMIAQVTGLKPGKFTHVINNAHIYENHVDALREQLSRRDQALRAPKIRVNSDITDFYEFSPDDIVLEGYEHLGKLAMTVAV